MFPRGCGLSATAPVDKSVAAGEAGWRGSVRCASPLRRSGATVAATRLPLAIRPLRGGGASRHLWANAWSSASAGHGVSSAMLDVRCCIQQPEVGLRLAKPNGMAVLGPRRRTVPSRPRPFIGHLRAYERKRCLFYRPPITPGTIVQSASCCTSAPPMPRASIRRAGSCASRWRLRLSGRTVTSEEAR